ncbi:hypothetical protein V1514DRAFT_338292 [Lipomyces japonicus]|uniref:uncharacterized protein n=1 Tax=Lipomyces japonicus TaxID=56871 RepID=UPI0034CE0E8F
MTTAREIYRARPVRLFKQSGRIEIIAQLNPEIKFPLRTFVFPQVKYKMLLNIYTKILFYLYILSLKLAAANDEKAPDKFVEQPTRGSDLEKYTHISSAIGDFIVCIIAILDFALKLDRTPKCWGSYCDANNPKPNSIVQKRRNFRNDEFFGIVKNEIVEYTSFRSATLVFRNLMKNSVFAEGAMSEIAIMTYFDQFLFEEQYILVENMTVKTFLGNDTLKTDAGKNNVHIHAEGSCELADLAHLQKATEYLLKIEETKYQYRSFKEEYKRSQLNGPRYDSVQTLRKILHITRHTSRVKHLLIKRAVIDFKTLLLAAVVMAKEFDLCTF